MAHVLAVLAALVGGVVSAWAQGAAIEAVHTRVYVIEFEHYREKETINRLDRLATLISYRANAKRIILISAESGDRREIEPEALDRGRLSGDRRNKPSVKGEIFRTLTELGEASQHSDRVILSKTLRRVRFEVKYHADRVEQEYLNRSSSGSYDSLNYVIDIFLVGQRFDMHRDLEFAIGPPSSSCFEDNELPMVNLRPFEPANDLPALLSGGSRPQDVRVTIVYDAEDNDNKQIQIELERFFDLMFTRVGATFEGILYLQEPRGRPSARPLEAALGEKECLPVEPYSAPAEPFMASNNPPIARNDGIIRVRAGQSLLIDVLRNDLDPEGRMDRRSVRIVDAPRLGGAVPDRNSGGIRYTALISASGQKDQFKYTVADEAGIRSQPATVTVMVESRAIPPSQPPTAAVTIIPPARQIAPPVRPIVPRARQPVSSRAGVIADIEVETEMNHGTQINVLEHIVDRRDQLNRDSLRIETGPSNGRADKGISGLILYAPQPGFVGVDEFTVTIADRDGNRSAPSTVTVKVREVVAASEPRQPLAPQPVTRQLDARTIVSRITWEIGGVDLDMHVFTPEFSGPPGAAIDALGHFWPKSTNAGRLFRDARQESKYLSERMELTRSSSNSTSGRYRFFVEVVAAGREFCGREVRVEYDISLPGAGSISREEQVVRGADDLSVSVPCDDGGIVRSGKLVLIGEADVQ